MLDDSVSSRWKWNLSERQRDKNRFSAIVRVLVVPSTRDRSAVRCLELTRTSSGGDRANIESTQNTSAVTTSRAWLSLLVAFPTPVDTPYTNMA